MNLPQNWRWRRTLAALLIYFASQGSAVAQSRSFSPADFLRRLDTNGNGMIDLNEMQGPASFMIQRLARDNPNINTSKPISIDALAREIDRLRQQRSSGGDPRRGGPSSGRGGSGNSSPSEPEKKVEPLVPGFGIENELPPVPGFGEQGEFFTVAVTEPDLKEAERAFRYYDRNRDGKLDREEISRSRSGDLSQYDKNRDGALTPKELAVRYAYRRLEREKQSPSSRASGSTSSGSRSEFSSRRGGERGSPFGGGRSGRGFSGFRSSRESGDRSREKDNSNLPSQPSSSSLASAASDRKSYRFLTPTERLPSGVPQWFIDRDQNGDGQLQMSEYADRWTDALAAEFSRFDHNNDGIVTPREVMAATDQGATPTSGGSGGDSSNLASERNEPSRTAGSASLSLTSAPADQPSRVAQETKQTGASVTSGGPPIDARTLSFFRKVLAPSDANKDGVLTKDEWSKMSKDPSSADANSDGRITVEEYARWKTNG